MTIVLITSVDGAVNIIRYNNEKLNNYGYKIVSIKS